MAATQATLSGNKKSRSFCSCSPATKFAEGIGVLSKNDIIDANVLARYGLMATKLIAWKPVPKEIAELQSLINRLSTLEKELQREKNRQKKMNE